MFNQCADNINASILPQKRKRDDSLTKRESLTPLLKKTVPAEG